MKIGIFDSGIGGLSVLYEAMHLLPHEQFIYYADEKHVPYGEKTKEEIKVAIAEADKAPKQKVSDFLKNMFEVQPQTIKEQIAFYEAKESK